MIGDLCLRDIYAYIWAHNISFVHDNLRFSEPIYRIRIAAVTITFNEIPNDGIISFLIVGTCNEDTDGFLLC